MTLLTTELPLVTNSDDDDSYDGHDNEISGMTLLIIIITGPLEHFFGNFEKEKDRSALGTAPV